MTAFRITFCILACLSAAVAVPICIFFSWWVIVPVFAMGIFTFLMVGFKNGFKRPEPPPKVDFMNSEEENEKIRRDNDKQ